MIEVKRTGRTWGIFERGELIEGGFFSRDAANEVAETYTPEPGNSVRTNEYERF
jgi:hypothetical protein